MVNFQKAQFPSSDVELLKAKELSTQLKDVKALLEEKKEENRMLLTDNDKVLFGFLCCVKFAFSSVD